MRILNATARGGDGGEGYELRRHSGNSELVGLTSAPAVSVETMVWHTGGTGYCFVKGASCTRQLYRWGFKRRCHNRILLGFPEDVQEGLSSKAPNETKLLWITMKDFALIKHKVRDRKYRTDVNRCFRLWQEVRVDDGLWMKRSVIPQDLVCHSMKAKCSNRNCKKSSREK